MMILSLLDFLTWKNGQPFDVVLEAQCCLSGADRRTQ